MERKLNRKLILESNIVSNVETIVKSDGSDDKAPLALRLSGQLLLGVVRIYSRKARFLYDDCNVTLTKIGDVSRVPFYTVDPFLTIAQMFKAGDVDSLQPHTANPASLTLADQLTDMDLLAPPPDPMFLLSQLGLNDLEAAPDSDFLNYSQVLSGSIQPPHADEEAQGLDDDIEIDMGQDDFIDATDNFLEGTSIERPRDAPLQRSASEEFSASPKLLEDDDIILDMGQDDLLGEDTSLFPAVDRDEPDTPGFPDLGRQQRDTLSALSSIRSSVDRELEKTVQGDQANTTFEPQDEEDETVHQQTHKAKRRKLLQADVDTELHSNAIRAHQNDRSNILKAASFLPRDPMLLALMTMQKSGGFVSSILGEGRSRGWAPELRGILSLEVVKRSGELKRKRFGEIEAPVDINLDANDDTIEAIKDTLNEDIIELPEDMGPPPPLEFEEEEAHSPIPDNFDDTTAPLLHPADSGPISLGTKHAVHLLRERFGPAASQSESERLKASVLFQDMLPERATTKADATRMFFEMLVLATKDAIKVEQPVNELGGPLHLRAKRGLWGSWAEAEAGGEIARVEEIAA
jgi:cohesin complex subunit SCC1